MSDLYLILRTRLEAMAEWVELGAAVMREARLARGLSAEAASRLLNVSTKTYDRNEKAGRWRAHDIGHLAEVLGLEIEAQPVRKVTLAEPLPDQAAAAARLADLLVRLEAVVARLEEGPARAQGE